LSCLEKEQWQKLSAKYSFIIEVFSICFFAAAKEPYVTALLFILLLTKVSFLIKSSQMK